MYVIGLGRRGQPDHVHLIKVRGLAGPGSAVERPVKRALPPNLHDDGRGASHPRPARAAEDDGVGGECTATAQQHESLSAQQPVPVGLSKRDDDGYRARRDGRTEPTGPTCSLPDDPACPALPDADGGGRLVPTDPDRHPPARPDHTAMDLWAPSTPAGATGPTPAQPPGGRGGRLGARRRSGAFGRPADEAAPSGGAFAVARNGYDRGQVELRISELTRQLAAAEEKRTEAGHRLAAERQRGEQVEQELSEVRAALRQAPVPVPEPARESAYGQQAERLLWLAEAEARGAREARAAATDEAAALLRRAHAEVEAHRREVERDLAARAAALEAEAGRRNAAADAREQEVAAELESARSEARQLRAAACREIDAMHRDAEEAIRTARAEAVRETDQITARRRIEAAAEVERLDELRRGLHEELVALHERITGALAGRTAEPRPTATTGPVRPASALPLPGRQEPPDATGATTSSPGLRVPAGRQ
jgi:hypothetical protein